VNDAYYSRSWQDAYTAYLLGLSYVGMRTEDVLVCARHLAERVEGAQARSVALVAVGNVGIPALHGAALEPDLFSHVAVSQMLASWSDVIHSRLSDNMMANTVHGALTRYDLPNLVTLMGDKVTISQPANPMGLILPESNRKGHNHRDQ
jgi:hypothetical protein